MIYYVDIFIHFSNIVIILDIRFNGQILKYKYAESSSKKFHRLSFPSKKLNLCCLSSCRLDVMLLSCFTTDSWVELPNSPLSDFLLSVWKLGAGYLEYNFFIYTWFDSSSSSICLSLKCWGLVVLALSVPSSLTIL